MIPKHPTHTAAHHNLIAGSEPAALRVEPDALTTPGVIDFSDGGDWEAAWIDLGGEG